MEDVARFDDAYGLRPAGYRLPPAARLGRVVLQVADRAVSVAYYERVVDLRTMAREGATVTLGAEGGGQVLVELREKHGAPRSPACCAISSISASSRACPITS